MKVPDLEKMWSAFADILIKLSRIFIDGKKEHVVLSR